MTIITKGMGKILTNIFKPKMPKASKGVTDRNIYSGKDNVKKMFKDLAKKGVTDRNISSKKMFKTMQELKNNRALKKVSQKNKKEKK